MRKGLVVAIAAAVAALGACGGDSEPEAATTTTEAATTTTSTTLMELTVAFTTAMGVVADDTPGPWSGNTTKYGEAIIDYCHDIDAIGMEDATEDFLDRAASLTTGHLGGSTDLFDQKRRAELMMDMMKSSFRDAAREVCPSL
ncbi:MAG: hypothetical protein M9906_04470 [Microthrixaceae bacterium]|nr:hypothetical protein [Microthrixaceae bacterium]